MHTVGVSGSPFHALFHMLPVLPTTDQPLKLSPGNVDAHASHCMICISRRTTSCAQLRLSLLCVKIVWLAAPSTAGTFKVCHTSCGKKWRMWLFAKDVGLRAVVLVHGMHDFDRRVNKRCQCMHASAFALNANVSILAGLEECHPA